MDFYKSFLRPMLFKMDPEWVHERALSMAAKGFIKEHTNIDYTALEQEMFGAKFKNPLGLAAGFDKNGIALANWGSAGFGFVELGTVTFFPQDGNPKPRMFRLTEDKALINRLGFNNEGARKVAENIAAVRAEIPYGINIGKSYNAPLEKAAEDYKKSFQTLHGAGNYFTINVSSPNTPGLRSLQDKDKLDEILKVVREIEPTVPLFVKVAPDLELTAIDDVMEVCIANRISGIVATNTTIGREGLTTPTTEGGGLSGKPLRNPSNRILAHIAKNSNGKLWLIGVGGIFSGADLYEKIALGAHLCQVYTGWIYQGPDMVPNCLLELMNLMDHNGFKRLEDLRGSGLS
ncbi:MAG TPA: quinone-dependent dihydroorotate dehydrogenase [Fimbriimonadaceae bacterium]